MQSFFEWIGKSISYGIGEQIGWALVMLAVMLICALISGIIWLFNKIFGNKGP